MPGVKALKKFALPVHISVCVACSNILKEDSCFLPCYLHFLFPDLIPELLYNGFCCFTEWQEDLQGRCTSFQNQHIDNSL